MDEGLRQQAREWFERSAILLDPKIKSAAAWREKGYELSASAWPR